MNEEEITLDPRQSPTPWSEEWNDPVWRKQWLNGLTDEQLAEMSPLEKGKYLRDYVWDSGYEVYGQDAMRYLHGINILLTARIPIDRLQRFEIVALGKAIFDWRLKSK